MNKKSVNVLHLSDLHFGTKPCQNTSAEQEREKILENLIKAIKNIPEEWRPDVVAVSGDIGWEANKKDYEKALKWFKQLSEEVCLTSDKFIFCPGNHDIDRCEAEHFREEEDAKYYRDCLSIENVSRRSSHFKNFAEFCKEFKTSPLKNNAVPDENGVIKYLYGYREVCGIDFIVLNSAWCCRGDNDLGKLWIGERLVFDVGNCIPENDGKVKIALFHHPLSLANIAEYRSYSNEPITQDSILKLSDIILNGHVHGKIGNGTFVENSAYAFTSGTAYQPNTYELSCQIIKIDTEEFTYSTRILLLSSARQWEGENRESNISLKKTIVDNTILKNIVKKNIKKEINSILDRIEQDPDSSKPLKREYYDKLIELKKEHYEKYAKVNMDFEEALEISADLYNEEHELNYSYRQIYDKSSIDDTAIYFISKFIISLSHLSLIVEREYSERNKAEPTENPSDKILFEFLAQEITAKIKERTKANVYVFEPHHDDFLGSASGLFFSDPNAVATRLITIVEDDNRDIDLLEFPNCKGKNISSRRKGTVIDHQKLKLADYPYQLRIDKVQTTAKEDLEKEWIKDLKTGRLTSAQKMWIEHAYSHELNSALYAETYYGDLVEHYKDIYKNVYSENGLNQLENRIDELLSELFKSKAKEKYIAVPLGIEHPMHILATHYCVKSLLKINNATIEEEKKVHILFYVDHPYDFELKRTTYINQEGIEETKDIHISSNYDSIKRAVNHYSKILKVDGKPHLEDVLVRADDFSVEQSNIGVIIKELYGENHYGEFGGVLENSMSSYYIPEKSLKKTKKTFNLHENNILYVTSQAKPFYKTGGLGEVAFTYVRALAPFVNKAAIIMPKYKKMMCELVKPISEGGKGYCVKSKKASDKSTNNVIYDMVTYNAKDGSPIFQEIDDNSEEYSDDKIIELCDYNKDDKGFYLKVYNDKKELEVKCQLEKYKYAGVTYYLVDIEKSFLNNNIFDSEASAKDFVYFNMAVIDVLRNKLDFKPSLLHCNDYQTALVPFIKKVKYPHYATDLKTVYTIHFYGYKGIYSRDKILDYVGIEETKCEHCLICNEDAKKSADCIFGLVHPYSQTDRDKYGISNLISLMKTGIQFADIVTTVSEGYANQIKDYPDFSGIKPHGIRNGIEIPSFDNIKKTSQDYVFDINALNFESAKEKNKLAFQKETKRIKEQAKLNEEQITSDKKTLGLEIDPTIPMFCMVTRLNATKGIEDIKNIFSDLMKEKLQLVIIGDDDNVGEDGNEIQPYANFFKMKMAEYPGKFFYHSFRNDLEFKAYLASDFLIMPSREEACGTTQMLAMKYGVLPIVSMLESFNDTIIDYNKTEKDDWAKGVGFFTFRDDCWHLLDMIKKITLMYDSMKPEYEENWNKLRNSKIGNILTQFNWENGSIYKYLKLYNSL